MAMLSETFCPSIYELLRKRVMVKDESHACGSLYIPDSVYINESKIVSWHFTSKYAGYVLRKSKENLTAEQVYQVFASAVHPLDICCLCVMVDMNRSADVIRRVEYLCPFQLYNLLLQLKQIDVTALLVKHIDELPEMQSLDGEGTDDAEQEQNKRLRRAIQEIRLKFNIRASGVDAPDVIQLKSDNYRNFRYVRGVRQSSHYDVVKVIYTPGVIQALGRRSLVAEDSRREPPGRRCATFFSDAERAEGHSVSQSVLLGLNQAFARMAVHLHAELRRPVVRLVAYVRVFPVPTRRKIVQGEAPVLLFLAQCILGSLQAPRALRMALSVQDLRTAAADLNALENQKLFKSPEKTLIDNNNDILAGIAPSQTGASEVFMDGETMSVIQMRIRKNFQSPIITPYDDIKDIMKQFYFQTFTQKVKAAIKINPIYQIKATDNNWIVKIMNDINSDLKSDRLQRQRVYAFFNGILEHCLLTDVHGTFGGEQPGLDEAIAPKNDLKGRYCCRCHAEKSRRLVKLKMLLAEPIYYFQSKFTFHVDISKISIRDCYALLHVCLFKDLSVMRFCDSAYSYLKSQELNQKKTLNRSNSMALSIINAGDGKTTVGGTSDSGDGSEIRSEYQKSVFYNDLVSGSEGEEYDQLFEGLASFGEGLSDISGDDAQRDEEERSLGGLIEAPGPVEFKNGEDFSSLFENSSLELIELRDFFELLQRIQRQSEKRRLDLYNLGRFYDVGQSDFGATCVPDKLLRTCGIARVSMEPRTFLTRTASENFMGRHFKVCDRCFTQLAAVWRSLGGR